MKYKILSIATVFLLIATQDILAEHVEGSDSDIPAKAEETAVKKSGNDISSASEQKSKETDDVAKTPIKPLAASTEKSNAGDTEQPTVKTENGNTDDGNKDNIHSWIFISGVAAAGIVLLLLVMLYPLILLRTRRARVDQVIATHAKEFESTLRNAVSGAHKDITAAMSDLVKKIIPSADTNGITVHAKLAPLFRDLRTEISNHKPSVDLNPVTDKLTQMHYVLNEVDSRSKNNDNAIKEQIFALQETQQKITQIGVGCERKLAELADSEEKIRNDERSKVNAAHENAQNSLRKHIDDLQSRINALINELEVERENSRSLKNSKEQAENDGYRRGVSEQIANNEALNKKIGQLEEQLSQISKEKDDLQLQEQQKYSSLLLQEKAAVEENFKNEIEKLKQSIANQEQNLNNKERDLQQALTDKNNAKQANTQKDSEINALKSTVEQQKQDIDNIRSEAETAKERSKKLEDEKDSLENENKTLNEHSNVQEEQIAALEQKNSAYETKIASLQNSGYPACFLSNESFIPLKKQLAQWLEEDLPGAEIVKSSLILFAARERFSDSAENPWQIALRNISFGITMALRSKNSGETDIVKNLIQWGNFLMSYSGGNFKFSFYIPEIGDNINIDDMLRPKDEDVRQVSRVITWKVSCGGRVKYLAEVE